MHAVAAPRAYLDARNLASNPEGAQLRWGSARLVTPRRRGLASVSCPTATTCVAVGAYDEAVRGVLEEVGYAVELHGGTWSSPRVVSPAGRRAGLVSVSCPTASDCTAVAADGDAYTFEGAAWHGPAAVETADQVRRGADVTSVSCATSTHCVVVASNGYAVFTGTSWSPVRPFGIGYGMIAVSCPSRTFCAALDSGGEAFTFNGSTWTVSPFLLELDPSHPVGAISCSSPSFCLVVGGLDGSPASSYAVLRGARWADDTRDVDVGHGVHVLDAVSCTSPAFCVAVDGNGRAELFVDSRWLGPRGVDPYAKHHPAGLLDAVSCTSPTSCEAVGSIGEAIRGS